MHVEGPPGREPMLGFGAKLAAQKLLLGLPGETSLRLIKINYIKNFSSEDTILQTGEK